MGRNRRNRNNNRRGVARTRTASGMNGMQQVDTWMINEIVPIQVNSVGEFDPLTPILWQLAAGPNGYAWNIT